MTGTPSVAGVRASALAGVAALALTDPRLRGVADRAGAPVLDITAPDAARPFLLAALAAETPLLVVTATGRETEDLTAELAGVLGDAVAAFPSWETLPHERLSPGSDTVGRRSEVLYRLRHPDAPAAGTPLRVVVTTVRSLIQPLAPGLGDEQPLVLRIGDEIDFEELLARLVETAYARVDMVGKRGEFAVRGGILDVFPTTTDHPVRIEFWGDEVTEIRSFAVADQRSIPDLDVESVVIHPCRELLLGEGVRAKAAALAAENPGDAALGELLEKLAQGVPADGMEALIPALVDGDLRLLPELMPEGCHVVVLDPEKVRTRADDLVRSGQEFLEASWTAASFGGDAPLDPERLDLQAGAYRTPGEVEAVGRAAGLPWWTVSPLSPGAVDADETRLDLEFPQAPAPRGDDAEIEKLLVMLRAHVGAGGTAAIVVGADGTVTRLVERLAAEDVPARALTAGDVPPRGLVGVLRGRLDRGIVLDRACAAEGDDPRGGLVLVAEADLTGNRVTGSGVHRKGPAKRRNQVDPLSLRAGDLVVHDQHGIGRFVEMTERTIKTGDGTSRREYLVIEYAASKRGQGGDRLYVPMDALDQLSRYVGGEKPTLSRMGGSDWKNTKSKARKAVREIAGELVQLYAARQASPGHAFAADTPWQREMEDAFPFTETQDQLTAISEVKADMERGVPMDRVVIGDVGYGKTEVAVRAAFKAVQDGRQVAVLVPTTLLAQQHLQTFAERMTGFPVTIRGLSRFTSPAESREILEGLADGAVDIVVGTHRLLQTGVRWKNLGLVIVDEEQRFGVEHKEHIKAMRTHVDVLTMSATPIPRTLEMSMAGIREMSTIMTPPEDRHPVLTYVGAREDKQIAAAVRRELLRDGQVFYVHNRVSSIDRAAKQLRDLVPEARVVVAHGQMNEDQLEKTVDGFWNREFDVLVCTTIVETGLDISNANTLIVERADQLGLSQLHQLRGRVGRSRERGYAYFLYPPEKPLTETAYDRLATIAQNNDLGAGMAVAMKDLELRGAGNVLGAEQSGHIAGVGFDLYVRLVGEAVEAFRAMADGKPVDGGGAPKEVRIDLPVDAHIPAEYVDGERLRLEAYRKLAQAESDADVAEVVEELFDRYGPPPEQVHRLISVARLRLVCRRHGVTEVGVTGTQLRVSPMTLLDSQQVRLRRLYPGSNYRATASQIVVPLPRTGGGGVGSGRIRDEELLQMVADLLTALAGEPLGSASIAAGDVMPPAAAEEGKR